MIAFNIGIFNVSCSLKAQIDKGIVALTQGMQCVDWL